MSAMHAEAKLLQLPDGLELFTIEEGEGPPIVLIPGWTATSGFFRKQIEHFRKTYRAISFDPRGQGKSSKQPTGNSYLRQGEDLHFLIDRLALENPILVGWSFGTLPIYRLIERHGEAGIGGCVFIDEAPRPFKQSAEEWGLGDVQFFKHFFDGIAHGRAKFTEKLFQWMLQAKPDAEAVSWMTAEALLTPDDTALALWTDGFFHDCREILASVRKPVHFFLAEDCDNAAQSYLKRHKPEASVTVLGGHAMFWTEPERFNAELEDFIRRCGP